MKSSETLIFAVMKANFCKCVGKPEKLRLFFAIDALNVFRPLYAIAKIAFITARITASLDLRCILTSHWKLSGKRK